MTRVHTILFVPPGQKDVARVELYTSELVTNAGYWVTSNNRVVLSSSGYQDYKSIMGDQPAIRKFFSGLQKVEQLRLE